LVDVVRVVDGGLFLVAFSSPPYFWAAFLDRGHSLGGCLEMKWELEFGMPSHQYVHQDHGLHRLQAVGADDRRDGIGGVMEAVRECRYQDEAEDQDREGGRRGGATAASILSKRTTRRMVAPSPELHSAPTVSGS
jgi:hypothetical protein